MIDGKISLIVNSETSGQMLFRIRFRKVLHHFTAIGFKPFLRIFSLHL